MIKTMNKQRLELNRTKIQKEKGRWHIQEGKKEKSINIHSPLSIICQGF